MSEKMSQDMVQHLADLSRLALSLEETVRVRSDLDRKLTAFNSLSKIEFPPLQAPSLPETEDALRPDMVDNSVGSALFLAQVPDREGAFVRVPATLSPST